jgi:hypothetical protein
MVMPTVRRGVGLGQLAGAPAEIVQAAAATVAAAVGTEGPLSIADARVAALALATPAAAAALVAARFVPTAAMAGWVAGKPPVAGPDPATRVSGPAACYLLAVWRPAGAAPSVTATYLPHPVPAFTGRAADAELLAPFETGAPGATATTPLPTQAVHDLQMERWCRTGAMPRAKQVASHAAAHAAGTPIALRDAAGNALGTMFTQEQAAMFAAAAAATPEATIAVAAEPFHARTQAAPEGRFDVTAALSGVVDAAAAEPFAGSFQ